MIRELVEDDIEKYLVQQVNRIGGEIRKVQWAGRRGAPDRRVMLPERRVKHGKLIVTVQPDAVWVEVKRPGGIAKFPCDERERAQQREHERMRRCGETVLLIDSKLAVDMLMQGQL